MSTALTTVLNENELDNVAPVKPSYIKFLQSTTSNLKGGQPGQFVDEMSGEIYDSMVVVPLRVVTNRIYYPPGSAFGIQPLCKSDDGVVPSPYIQTPQAVSCKACPNSVWHDNKPSACNTVLKMLTILKETGMPRFIVPSGSSVSPLRNMLRRINENMQVANLKAQGQPGTAEEWSSISGNTQFTKYPKLHLYDYFFTISSEKKKNYHVMTFSDVKRVANPGEFGFLYEKFVSTFNQQPQSDEAETAISEVIPEI